MSQEEIAVICTEAVIDYWEGNLTDLKDVAETLREEKDQLSLAEQVAARITSYIEQAVEKESLCPQCFTQLEPVTEREMVGYYGSAPAYENVVVANMCSRCGHREVV